MSAKQIESDRKRSRPVTKRSAFDKNKLLLPFLALVIVLAVVISGLAIIFINPFGQENTNVENGNGEQVENPTVVFDTTMGIVKAEIYLDKVPITAQNFIDHVNDGYYNGIIFHRVITDFMIQGGDPLGTGTGGHAARYHSGYGIESNPDTWVIPDEFHDELKHDSAGILSMANSGPNTGGSQFFITVKETPWLDGAHAVFGKVTEGLDVVIAISELDPEYTDASNKPLTDVVMNSVSIESN